MATNLCVCSSLVAIVMIGVHAPACDAALPPDRLAALERGVNVSSWMWIPEAGKKPEDAAARRAFISDAELARLRAIGLTHLRLPFEPEWMWDAATHALRPAETDEYFEAVERCVKVGLAVIIDPHYLTTKWVMAEMIVGRAKATPDARSTPDVGNEFGTIDELERFWAALAARATKTDPSRVFLEVLNEPHDFKDQKFWPAAQARLVPIIRRAAPTHTIIATGDDWGGIAGLLRLTPLADDNIVYSFHFYDPMFFTHQSAEWGWVVWRDLKGVPWPATRAQLEGIAAGQVDKEVNQHVMWSIDRDAWTEEKLKARLKEAAAWGTKNGVPVYCGEYGVYAKASAQGDRVGWTGCVNKALDELHVGRAMWDYVGGFRMMTGKAGERVMDEDIARAMGLTVK